MARRKLSHEDGEGKFFGFARGEEAEIEGFEDWVVAGGNQGGHVEDRADLGAPSGDVALAAELAAVAIKGSDAGERGRLGVGEGAELGHESDQGGGGERADALDLAEALDPGEQRWGLSDLGLHERFEVRDLFAEEGDGFGDEAEEVFVGEGLGEIVVLGDLGEQMGAVLDQSGQLLLGRIGPREGAGRFGQSRR